MANKIVRSIHVPTQDPVDELFIDLGDGTYARAMGVPAAGAVGGAFSIEAALTKSATTTFTAGDVVAATTPAVITFANAARALGAGGIITNAAMSWSTVISPLPTFELYLFETLPTALAALADSDPFAPTDAEMADCIGVVTFDAADAKAGTLNTLYQGSFANGNIPFKCGALVDDLYGILVTRTTGSLGASDVANIRLGGQQD